MNITSGQKFNHADYRHGKKPLTLVVHKITPEGAVIAHREGDEMDERGYYDNIAYFGLGLNTEDTRFL